METREQKYEPHRYKLTSIEQNVAQAIDVRSAFSYHGVDTLMSTPRSRPSEAAQQTPEIPDKLYFRIGEVAQIAGVEPYVLRFWETEFPNLAPKKSGTGHRLFKRKDVETILEVKRLLYEKRFTIEGARLYIEQNKKKGTGKQVAVKAIPPAQAALFSQVPLEEIRNELREILALLA